MKPIRLTDDHVKGFLQKKEAVSIRCTLDKDMAQWLLDHVNEEKQRARQETTIHRYLTDMNSGNWKSGTDVGMDGKGQVLQGQHMLVAFIRSNLKLLEITFKISFEEDAHLAFDHGRKRSHGEDLKWQGYDAGGKIAPVVVVLWQYEQGFYKDTAYTAARSAKEYPTASQLLEAAKMHPHVERRCVPAPHIFQGRGIPIAAIWAASYILHNLEPDLAPIFFTSLFEGTDIPPKSPIHVLRESLERRKGKQRLRNGECLAWIFKTWMAWISGGSGGSKRPSGGSGGLKRPIMRPGEPFPELIPQPEHKSARAARVQ